VAAQEVIEMNRRLDGDISLNAPMRASDSGEWQDRLIDGNATQEERLAESEEGGHRLRALERSLTALSRRELRIFAARHLAEEPLSVRELAAEFGLSSERVRQIERRAFQKIQEAVRNHMATMELSGHLAIESAARDPLCDNTSLSAH